MTEPVELEHPFFGTETSPAADPAPPAEETGAAELQPEVPAEPEPAAEPEPTPPPAPAWLIEVRNNAPAFLVTAVEELLKLTGTKFGG